MAGLTGTDFGSLTFNSAPLVLNTVGGSGTSTTQPVASGFSFDLPLATVAAFNQQALDFSGNNAAGAAGFLSNVLTQNQAVAQNASQTAFASNMATITQAFPILSIGLQGNTAIGLGAAQHSGGLFGGGGFLGLGF